MRVWYGMRGKQVTSRSLRFSFLLVSVQTELTDLIQAELTGPEYEVSQKPY